MYPKKIGLMRGYEREDIERGRCENANMRVEQGWEAMKEKSGKKTGERGRAESEREDIERWRCENANMKVEQGWEAMKEKSGKKTGKGNVRRVREKI